MSRIDTWEELQARLFHLGWLGEELPGFVAASARSAWLYRQIALEAGRVAALAADYVAEAERAAVQRDEAGRRAGHEAGTQSTRSGVPDTDTQRAGGDAL